RGVRRTWITETLTMLAADKAAAPVLISVKALDPKVYPFYGAVKLDPPGTIAKKLTPGAIAVSEDLLLRMHLGVGDTVHIGGQDFTIIGTLQAEPDRMSGSLNVGPRVMMSREGLQRTELVIPGSRASERFLFRVPPGMSIETVRGDLKKVFSEGLIVDFRQTNPIIEQGLQRATTFLSLVSLIALIVGALGVSTAMQSHLQQKMDSIAVMKCLGARSSQIMRIYLIQTIGLGLAGGLLGIAMGIAVQRAFPLLIARYFQMRPAFSWDALSAVQGLGIGILSTLLFTVPALLSIRGIRPGVIFRREMAETRPPWKARLRQGSASIASAAIILLGIGAIAGWLSDSARMGMYFAGGLAASLLALAAVAWLLLRGLKWFTRRAPRGLRAGVRHGIANLYRPGNHAEAALVALGVGVMFTLTIYLVQRGLLAEVIKSAPPGMPNVFLLDITPRNRDEVAKLLARQRGVEGAPEMVGTVSARISSINGVPLDRQSMKGFARRYAGTMAVTTAAEKPLHTVLRQGAWWNASWNASKLPPSLEPQLSVSEDAAKVLRVKPGDRLEWSTPARKFQARIAAIHKTESIRLSARVEFIFTPGALDGFPMIYYGSVRVKPPGVPGLQRAIYDRFPTVTVVNVADVMQIVQDVVDQISLVIRFISGFAILAGAIILASSVAGTRFRRIREVVILKTLGATRNRVAEIFSVEFLVLGLVAGLMGSLLASGFAALLLNRLLDAHLSFDPVPNVICVLLTAVIANAAGWLASFRILGQKPLEILRQE
ncbi:MAG: FtsX-like permease family protein, partial [Acidobacteriota bacterium]|nr:FtsX-like permease family protein [Acidobacteriota bacterium]